MWRPSRRSSTAVDGRSSTGPRPSRWTWPACANSTRSAPGCWRRCRGARHAAGHRADMVGVADNYAGLIEEVRQVNRSNPAPAAAPNPVVVRLNEIGRSAVRRDGRRQRVPADAGLALPGAGRRAAQAEVAAADIAGLSALSGRLAGDADHGADHLPDRRASSPSRASSISASSAPIPMSSTWSAFWCCAKSAC